jgi:hypothetical protein
MAAIVIQGNSTEVLMDVSVSWSAKTITVTDVIELYNDTNGPGLNITWDEPDNLGGLKITKSDGTPVYDNTLLDTNPDIVGGTSTKTLTLSSLGLLDSFGNIIEDQYTVQYVAWGDGSPGTAYSRSFVLDLTYSSPEVDLDIEYDTSTPIYLRSVDSTNYSYNAVTPTITRAHTIYHPNNNGTVTGTGSTLSTGVFYTGVTTSSLTSTLSYSFNGYYADAPSADVTWTLLDSVTGGATKTVIDNAGKCDLFCCLEKIYSNYETALTAGRISEATSLKSTYDRAFATFQMIDAATQCSLGSKAGDYVDEFKKITSCTGDCGCSDNSTPVQVVGIGQATNIVRAAEVELQSNSTSYTWPDLINYNYADGDFFVEFDGQLFRSAAVTESFNPVTGEFTFGTTLPAGTKIAYQIVKP